MSQIKDNVNKKDLILLIIILIIAIISLTLFVKEFAGNKEEQQDNNVSNSTTTQNSTNNQVSVPQTQDEIAEELSKKGERDRMEYYVGEYFKHLEKGEYDEAYNMLYAEFKQNYFPTVEKFEEYVKKTYPSTWALDYDDISRQGDIYVLRLKIYDVLGSKENEKVQRIVVKENNYNDFVLSFQVI